MKTAKFVVGVVLFFAGIIAGAGEMPDASLALFLFEKAAALAAILIGLHMANDAINN